jgi:hypothetical protein
MGANLVVAAQPVLGDVAGDGDRFEDVRVENLVTEAAVEALDDGVLVGLAVRFFVRRTWFRRISQ